MTKSTAKLLHADNTISQLNYYTKENGRSIVFEKHNLSSFGI